MKISDNGLSLIKKYEGCQLKAYKDSKGVWTIGYGTTSADKTITGTAIRQGLQISKETAETWFRESIDKKYGLEVEKYNSIYKWNQNEFDALVSFAYNIGSIDKLTAKGSRTRSEIADKIPEYNRSGGQVLAGLTRRREEEQALFLTPIVTAAKEGWQQESGSWKFYEKNKAVTNAWRNIGGKYYWFDGMGRMIQNDWKKTDGKWYYLSENGVMVKNKILAIKNEIFAFGSDGAMLEGTFTVHTNSRGAIEV